MTDLLNQLYTLPLLEQNLTLALFLIAFLSLMFFIVSLGPKRKFKTSFLLLITVLTSTAILFKIKNENNHIRKTAIENKDYMLTTKGSILEFTSYTPYIESKKLKIIHQNDKHVQVEYNGEYFDINKSQEKIDATN